MALQDLNRAGDTPITTLKLADITPKNWHRFPAVTPSVAPINANAGKPSYATMADWAGGAVGDDVSVSTAAVALANSSGGANEADYTPRTEAARATQLGVTMAPDVGRPRGGLEPDDPYPVAATPPLTAPTITSLAPNTAVTGPNKPTVAVTITGTGFTAWSTVTSGNFPIPARYLSPTTLEIIQKPSASVPGIVSVVVTDHGVASAGSNFTFT